MTAAEIARLKAAGNKTTRDLCDALEQSQAAVVEVGKERDLWKGSSCALEAIVRENDDKILALRARLEAAKAALHAVVSIVLGTPENEFRGRCWDRIVKFANEARAAIAEMEKGT